MVRPQSLEIDVPEKYGGWAASGRPDARTYDEMLEDPFLDELAKRGKGAKLPSAMLLPYWFSVVIKMPRDYYWTS